MRTIVRIQSDKVEQSSPARALIRIIKIHHIDILIAHWHLVNNYLLNTNFLITSRSKLKLLTFKYLYYYHVKKSILSVPIGHGNSILF